MLVEFWATWCPPCRSTLEWLSSLKRKYGGHLAILALAVESPDNQVCATAGSLNPDIRWAISDAQTARAFGDVVAVPTMLMFDRSGKTVRVLYGAPRTSMSKLRKCSMRWRNSWVKQRNK